MARLSSTLFKAARAVDTAEAIASGDPVRMARRGRNIMVGRAVGRVGFWQRLFLGGSR